MQIPIPRLVVRAADRLSDWANVSIWERGRFELRRLDLVVVALFFVCVAYYWHTSGPMGALQGGALYIALAAMAIWIF